MRSWTPPSPLPGRIETARTVIRPYRKGDGPLVYDAIAASRGVRWLALPWLTGEGDVDDCVYFVERKLRQATEPGCRDFGVGVFARDERTFLGGVGWHRITVEEATAEVGYWVRGDRHGQGLCTEAVGAFVTAGFTAQPRGWGFRRITLLCAADNHASRRVADKLGFRLERRELAERHDPLVGPDPLDSVGYALLAPEWDPTAHRARPDTAAPPP